MGLRQTIQNRSGVVVLIAGLAIAISVISLVIQASGVHRTPTTKAFFSSDDGKTWFKDDGTKAFPFQHDGNPAYRAQIFRCGQTEFCGYLESLPENVKEGIDAVSDGLARAAALQSASDQILVKKPRGTAWINSGGKDYASITTPLCPDGSNQEVMPVNPNQ
jgi:hypothetical protein